MESTLSLTRADLEVKVGDFQGYGLGPAYGDPAWDRKQQYHITDCVQSGFRQFYYPEPLPGESTGYDWSFLKPIATVVIPQGQQVTPLPDDFGGIEGEVILVGASLPPIPLPVTGLVRLRIFQFPSSVGQPRICEVEPVKAMTPTTGQRWQLAVWPKPDQDYTAQVHYFVNPDYATALAPYPYGGPQHSETLIESCLAIAEQRRDDAMTVHTEKFMRRLAASVAADRKLKPQLIGYCGDASDNGWWPWRRNWRGWEGVVTYNGITPD